MANRDEIRQVWKMLAIAYPDFAKTLDAKSLRDTIALYELMLADVDGEVLRAAVTQHIASSQWFPKISEIRERVAAILTPERDTGLEAWGKLMDGMRNANKISWDGNGYEPPDFAAPPYSDPILQRLVDSMGWRYLCQSENAMADRAHFLAAYKAIGEREHVGLMTLPIVRELAARLSADRDRKQIGGGDVRQVQRGGEYG